MAAEDPPWSAEDIEAECERHYPQYWLGLDTAAHAIFAELARAAVNEDRDGQYSMKVADGIYVYSPGGAIGPSCESELHAQFQPFHYPVHPAR